MFNIENCNATPTLRIENLKLTEELDEKTLDATLFKYIVGLILAIELVG